ncbi:MULTISPECIES: heavy metal translocating P-type ATPase [Undibacterium]|uniref:Heavy metal translocating P-type ATPase n=2 Tax=Undibacterium TaxID=401469 RepID=A0A941E4C7_9BURK|nr:heavy metal translocating P-type ATPase [Undibacterium fentianense]MBR7798548.1 heavy metal translocating P-type ATPase [Undibacterium fentianense]
MSSTTESQSACATDKPDCGCANATTVISAGADTISSAGTTTVVYRIENMDCPTEETLIRQKLASIKDIAQLNFNLLERKLTVKHHLVDDKSIQSALQDIGMQVELINATEQSQQNVNAPTISNRSWWLAGLGIASAVAAEVIAWISGNESSWEVIVLSLFAIMVSGIGTYKKGWIALTNFNLNINALMAIAVTGAVIIGQWPEAAMVMVLFSLSEMIEALSLDRARNAIRGLMAMAPEQATVRQVDGSWLTVGTDQIQIGAILRVAPGERVPLDGILTEGASAIDQAPITGESIPVAKNIGDQLFAGTINQSGSFLYRVTSLKADSALARIIVRIEEAQASRAPTQRFVDQFAKVYTPVVFLLALAVMIVPPVFFALPWSVWVYKALVLLVIACPCALVVSTPVTVVSGLAAAAKAGILIKGGVYLEDGRNLKVLALDKTGTITLGKPSVTDISLLQGDANMHLQLAASLAIRSDHPVSGAISRYWQTQFPTLPLTEVVQFEALMGRGVKARMGDQWFYLGNHRLVEELGICNTSLEATLRTFESDGKTVVILCNETTPLLMVAVADTVRETSRQAITELHAMGVRTIMLTGDNTLTAKAIARHVGIDDARGDLLPEGKLAAIHQEIAQYGRVGMVGDGINDAPALAKAHIGFAMGAAGTDTALETADVALMDDDLRKIPQFIQLSQRTSRILKQNISLALGIKMIFLVLAVFGSASLWMAVFADMGASLLVIFNGLRLLKFSAASKSTVKSFI